jgi:hypothetical protein
MAANEFSEKGSILAGSSSEHSLHWESFRVTRLAACRNYSQRSGEDHRYGLDEFLQCSAYLPADNPPKGNKISPTHRFSLTRSLQRGRRSTRRPAFGHDHHNKLTASGKGSRRANIPSPQDMNPGDQDQLVNPANNNAEEIVKGGSDYATYR